MASLADLVGLAVITVGGGFLLGFVGALIVHLIPSPSSHDRASMPSHYSSLLQADPSNYPGYCPECGANNDPECDVCRNCSARLPSHASDDRETDLESIFQP